MSETSSQSGANLAPDELFEVSRRYGSDPDYVLAGGGNTSWKDGDVMVVKASGSSLATASPEGFCGLDLAALGRIWTTDYPQDADAREAAVLDDMMAARLPGEEDKRPSVEALLHALFPQRYVVHTHPSLVNGATCAFDGKKTIARLFPDALWVPIVEPGYVLAKRIRDLAGAADFPQVIFLQNHGVFVAADSLAEIDRIYADIMEKLGNELRREPAPVRDLAVGPTGRTLEDLLPGHTVLPFTSSDLLGFAESAQAFEPLRLSFTPDHIVYYGYRPLYVEAVGELAGAIEQFRKDDGGRAPRIIVVKGEGAFGCHEDLRRAQLARDLFVDDLKVAVYTESFGGHSHLPDWFIQFIRTWEVEKYRSSVTK